MSCCNTCGSTQGCNCQYTVVLPDNPVEAYTCANINLTGIGVYDSQNGNEFDFRGITSGNNSLIVTLDAGNNSILLTFNIQQIIDDLPDATTTQRGVLETATDAEAIGKALDTKILTPSNLAAIGATSSFAGLIEIATDAEALAGASTSLAITPANLAYVNDTQLTTQVFADDVARAAAVPAFKGQFGFQLDKIRSCVANGTNAGDWVDLLTGGSAWNSFNGASLEITNATTFIIGGTGTFEIDIATTFTMGGMMSVDAAGTLDFVTGSLILSNGVTIPANSVLRTNASAGNLSSSLISTFISTSNTQTGYTTFSNPSTLRTCDTATVTLQQLAQIVGTLITDLKAVKLPAT